MKPIQGQSRFSERTNFSVQEAVFASAATRIQPSCFGGVEQVHFNKDPNNPWRPVRTTSLRCIKEALKYEGCRWKIELLTNWKCLLEVRIILWKPLWVLEYLQSVQIGGWVQCYCLNMPWDFSSVWLMEQVARFSTELSASGGQGPCRIHLGSHTIPSSSQAVDKYWMKESLHALPNSLTPSIKCHHIHHPLLHCFIFSLRYYCQLSCDMWLFLLFVYYLLIPSGI